MKTTTTLTALTLAAILGAAIYTALPAGAQDGAMVMGQDMGQDMGMGMGPGGGSPMPSFEALDADRDGTITAAEMAIFRKAAITGTDSNADGKMSADELTAQQVRVLTERVTDRSARMVLLLDVDSDGLLSVEELAAGPGPMRMFDRMDADGDGAITKAEADAAQQKMQDRHKGQGREGRGDGHRCDRHHGGQGDGRQMSPGGDDGAN